MKSSIFLFSHVRAAIPKVALLVVLCLAGGTMTGCATFDKTLAWFGLGDSNIGPETPEILAMRGMDEFNRGKYHQALKIFEDIKVRFPFSVVGLLAELKAADAKYYMEQYAEALVLYEEFEANHPTNEAIPYVLFQMGMCHYQQIDTIDRDPAGAVNAVAVFSRLLEGFPGSPYEQEARARIRAARNFLANHEMYVAAFYVKTEEYDQAEGRLRYLLKTFPKSDVAPKAKELLVAVQSDNPPKQSWRDWLPDLSLPTWKSFVNSFSAMPVGTSGSGPSGGGE